MKSEEDAQEQGKAPAEQGKAAELQGNAEASKGAEAQVGSEEEGVIEGKNLGELDENVNFAEKRKQDGERPEQNNDAGQERPDGSRMAGDSTGEIPRDLQGGVEGVLEDGLAASRREHSHGSERDRREEESERLVKTAKGNNLYFGKQGIGELGEKQSKKTGESEAKPQRGAEAAE